MTRDLSNLPAPIVEVHDGIHVVRDDLLPGGTKLRYLGPLAAQHKELVYASSAQGGAQLALAYAAREAGTRATIFVAHRSELHPRTIEAKRAGAKVFQVEPGYLTVVQARARQYAETRGAFYVAFGGESPEALAAIARAAADVWRAHGPFDEVWCATGSGVLARGLQQGMPDAGAFVCVCCGHHHESIGRARIRWSGVKYGHDEKRSAPFPACPTYERKAWQFCKAERGPGRVLFWNVLGPSPTMHMVQR